MHGMKRATILAIWMLGACAFTGAQKKSNPQPVYEGPLELPCARILAMPSSDYIAQIVAIDDSNVDGQLRGIRRYGACYDARTDRFAASLAKTGKAPRPSALKDFRNFDQATKDFTAKALTVTQPPADAVKTAYAALYEKQFRYAFYQSYGQKAAKQPLTAEKNEKDATAAPTAAATTTPAQTSPAKPITEPMTLAKNRFGELLAALPEDKRREIHRAFGEIFEKGPIGEQWKLEVYDYAIFILESPKDKPFSPPPF
jgi:hypothetical protein